VRYLTVGEVLSLHDRLLATTGGAAGVRDLGIVESAVAQPKATFGGADLYPSLVEKAAALGFSLVRGHAFLDGNKRIAHAALEVFLVLNGHELVAHVDEQEMTFLGLAEGTMTRDELVEWLRRNVRPL
jgi:death-on-curing protein